MSADRFKVIDPGSAGNYRDAVIQVARASWPEFMWQDHAAEEYWHELFDRFAEYQSVLLETATGRVAAIGHSLPFRCDQELSELPEEGWDWVIQKAVQDHKHAIEPNMQAAIMVAIAAEYRRQGLSKRVLQSLQSISETNGFKHLVVPVRPNQKSQYPLISMDDYLKWKTQDGLPFDAWLRVHVRAGGRITKVCHASKTILGARDEWETWTDLRFPQSGSYVVPGALNPLEMNVEKDEGIYIEPNVWIAHEIS